MYTSIFMILNYSVKKSIINRTHTNIVIRDLKDLLIEDRLNNLFIRYLIVKDE